MYFIYIYIQIYFHDNLTLKTTGLLSFLMWHNQWNLPALAIDKNVTRLKIPVYNIPGVHILDGIDQLIHNKALVNVLENVSLFDNVV